MLIISYMITYYIMLIILYLLRLYFLLFFVLLLVNLLLLYLRCFDGLLMHFFVVITDLFDGHRVMEYILLANLRLLRVLSLNCLPMFHQKG